MSKFNFSDQDKIKIKETIEKVEKNTSGEIVLQIVKKSDNYYEAPFIASLIVAFFLILMIVIMSELWILPFKFDVLIFCLIFIAIVFATFLLVELLPFFKMLFISEKRERRMVHKNAVEAFLNNEIFKTKERTGILIFISELERNVEILADSGINQKVKPEDWERIVKELTKGIKSKQIVSYISKSIEDCGNLLMNAGFSPSSDNPNELPNELILK